MIAQRFRAIGYAAFVATAATGLYLISLQAAAERGRLEAVEGEIAKTKRDLRQLQTEFGTRASMRQLEQWNGEVLALSAPKAHQFVKNGVELAAVTEAPAAPMKGEAPPPMMASVTQPKAAPKTEPKVAKPLGGETRDAIYIKPREEAAPKLQRVVLVDPAFGRELIRAAEQERRKRP